jgi:hypothetical protein
MPTSRRISTLLVVLSLMLAFGDGVSRAGRPSVKQVGTDEAGDWGDGVSPAAADAGGVAGQDLIGALIGPGDPGYLDFVIHVSTLAPAESTAAAVYEWYFQIGDRQFGFYGPCQGHVYGSCGTATDPLAFVLTDFSTNKDVMAVAEVNENAATITFPVSLSFLGATAGSLIEPRSAGTSVPQEAIVAHTFYFVNSPTGARSPRDYMSVTKNYRVRRES